MLFGSYAYSADFQNRSVSVVLKNINSVQSSVQSLSGIYSELIYVTGTLSSPVVLGNPPSGGGVPTPYGSAGQSIRLTIGSNPSQKILFQNCLIQLSAAKERNILMRELKPSYNAQTFTVSTIQASGIIDSSNVLNLTIFGNYLGTAMASLSCNSNL